MVASRTAHNNENSLVPPPPVYLSSQRAKATPFAPRRSSKTSRAFVYSLLTRGRPFPDVFLFRGFVLLHGKGIPPRLLFGLRAEYPAEGYTDIQFSPGVFLSILVMGINIHSDCNASSSGSLEKSSTGFYKVPCSCTFLESISFLRSLNGWAMSWPLGLSSALILAFFSSLSFLGLWTFHHHRFHLKILRTTPSLRKPSFHSSFKETK